MESLINFLEQYWGYTIFGGMSIGTIVTFIVVQIKTLLANKAKDTKYDAAVTTITDTATKTINELNAKYIKSEEDRIELAKRYEYLERVQATTFKAISYIIMASKLPTEDKIALQSEFTKLLTTNVGKVVEQTVEVIKSEEPVIVEYKQDVVDVVKDTVVQTDNLLSKYTAVK